MGGIRGSCGGLDQGQADVMCKLSFSFSEFIQVVSRPYPFEREGESEKREIERVERERDESEREERERGEREKYETDLPCAPASQAPPQCRVLLRGHDHGRVGSTGSHVLRLQPESWPTCASRSLGSASRGTPPLDQRVCPTAPPHSPCSCPPSCATRRLHR